MKYWVYMSGDVPGSYEPEELARISGFTAASMVCPAGGPLESRNWQQAGLYPEIVGALEAKDAAAAPSAPRPPEPPPRDFVDPAAAAASPEDMLGAASHRLFRHVTGLMKELENRREERALTQSLQRALVEVKNELQAARERIRFLDDRVSLIPGFEDRERRLQQLLEKAREDLRARDEASTELERRIEAAKLKAHEAETARDNALRAQDEAVRDQRRFIQSADELNRQLAQKELTLAKALAVIGRLEEELGKILPQAAAPAGDWPAGTAAAEGAAASAEPSAAAPEASVSAEESAVQPEPLLEPEVLRAPDPGLTAAAAALDPPAAQPEAKPPVPEGEPPVAPSPGFKTVPPPWKEALDDVAAFFKHEKRKAKGGPGPKPPAGGNA